jgi:serine/threonine protein kinase
MIGKTILNYKIISLIGEGGMGTVYLAEHGLILFNNNFRNSHLDFCILLHFLHVYHTFFLKQETMKELSLA